MRVVVVRFVDWWLVYRLVIIGHPLCCLFCPLRPFNFFLGNSCDPRLFLRRPPFCAAEKAFYLIPAHTETLLGAARRAQTVALRPTSLEAVDCLLVGTHARLNLDGGLNNEDVHETRS
jgi:hypothetical protein